MMSKKDYVKFAQAVKESKDKDELVENMIRISKADNGRFDEGRFKWAAKGE